MNPIEITKKPLILIVDDVPANLQILGNILKEMNVKIAFATNGEQAVEFVQSYDVDLMLLDVMMPVMDGFKVCETIKNMPTKKDIPIIFITARSETNDIVKGFQLGASDYVTKPFNPAELLVRVTTQLELKKAQHMKTLLIASLEEKTNALELELQTRKKAEKRLQDARKMETIASLAGGIAHNFNNSLQTIIGNIELLQLDIQRCTPEKMTHQLDKIMNSAMHLSHLTKLLLAYARKGKYIVISISVPRFVHETIELIRPMIRDTIDIQIDLAHDTYPIQADLAQMQMVFSSLITNSQEAIADKGVIRIKAYNQLIDKEFRAPHDQQISIGNYVCFQFYDSGKGIDEDTKNHLFEPFYSTKYTGRGLELAAVYGIIQNHSGCITIESVVNQYTMINIFIPAYLEQNNNKIKA